MFKDDEKGPMCFPLNKPVLAGVKCYKKPKHMKPVGLSSTLYGARQIVNVAHE